MTPHVHIEGCRSGGSPNESFSLAGTQPLAFVVVAIEHHRTIALASALIHSQSAWLYSPVRFRLPLLDGGGLQQLADGRSGCEIGAGRWICLGGCGWARIEIHRGWYWC